MKPFHESEIIIGTMGTLLVDGLSALLDTVAIGVVISPVIQSSTTFLIGRWVKNKGGTTSFSKELVKHASNLVPWVPTTFLTFAIVVFIHNRTASNPLSAVEATA